MILEKIESPADLKTLDRAELDELASEIRKFLVDSVSKTGGHLGPNLGVVELTLAVHRVFDSPKDAIVWDTGHQAYVHKIVTGRSHRFDTLRQEGGLSGYPSRAESVHDLVENSHASVSLGYAAGLAEARRRAGIEGKVVAVVGDGALTGGVALEALNNIGAMALDVLVVLNDNGRSYQPTVGSIASYLSRLRLSPRYRRAKREIENILTAIPRVGESLAAEARRVKQGIKQLVAPQVIFEDLGFYYAGPIDGHDLGSLEQALHLAKDVEGPVLVHVLTEKGHGYGPAVEDEVEKLHALGAFDPETGKPTKPKARSWTAAFAEELCRVAERRSDVLAITAAMASPTGLSKLAEKYPERVFDVGIAEQFATVFAAGLAMGGARPVVAIYSTFLQRAFDQLMMDVCLHNLPVLFVIDRAGITGDDGPSHHGVFDLTYLRALPNMVVAAPRDEWALRDLIATALSHDGPFAIRFPKGSLPSSGHRAPVEIPVGSWEVLRDGSDVCFLATGKMVTIAAEAADKLEANGVSVRLVDSRFVKPLDPALPEYVSGCDAVFTLEDNVLAGGFGSAVLEELAERRLNVDLIRIGVPHRFLEHASQDRWFERLKMDAEGICRRVLTYLNERAPISDAASS